MENKIILKPGQRIRTLGVYQPYAGLILHGKVETRWVGSIIDKKTGERKYRKPPFPFGKYLIYATIQKYRMTQVAVISGVEETEHIFAVQRENYISDFVIHGKSLCLADLVEIIDPITPETKNTFVLYQPPTEMQRRVGLVFQNLQRIEPFTFKGKQGVGFFSEDLLPKIQFI